MKLEARNKSSLFVTVLTYQQHPIFQGLELTFSGEVNLGAPAPRSVLGQQSMQLLKRVMHPLPGAQQGLGKEGVALPT